MYLPYGGQRDDVERSEHLRLDGVWFGELIDVSFGVVGFVHNGNKNNNKN